MEPKEILCEMSIDKESVRRFFSLRELLTGAVEADPQHIAFKYKRDKEIVSVTNRALLDDVEALGTALRELGFGESHIAILGENGYPWAVSFYAVLLGASVAVPLDKELDEKTLVYLLNESDSTCLICDEKHAAMLAPHRAALAGLEKIIVFERARSEGDILSFSEVMEAGRLLDKSAYRAARTEPHTLKDLVYTSGTTGTAKGVMLSEQNLVSCIYYGLRATSIAGTGLSVLPYHHTYEATCEILVSPLAGTTLCINDNLRHVAENMRLFKPDFMMLVPAFAEHFVAVVQNNIKKQGKERLFAFMVKLSRFLRRFGIDLRRKFFRSVLAGFGGNLRHIVCGGAPIRPDIGKFFDDIGILMVGGYGITECAPLVSANEADGTNNFSSAGKRLECLEWRIEGADERGIGEILVKGENVMLGYYKRPDLTAEVMEDGWFHTGDYGYINDRDEIVITGRKKNIIVLNNGKNIYPEELEGRIQSIASVVEVVVSGVKNEHGQDIGLCAEVYCGEENIPEEAALTAEIERALADLPRYKHISRVTVRREPFPKTTTRKIKRT